MEGSEDQVIALLSGSLLDQLPARVSTHQVQIFSCSVSKESEKTTEGWSRTQPHGVP